MMKTRSINEHAEERLRLYCEIAGRDGAQQEDERVGGNTSGRDKNSLERSKSTVVFD